MIAPQGRAIGNLLNSQSLCRTRVKTLSLLIMLVTFSATTKRNPTLVPSVSPQNHVCSRSKGTALTSGTLATILLMSGLCRMGFLNALA